MYVRTPSFQKLDMTQPSLEVITYCFFWDLLLVIQRGTTAGATSRQDHLMSHPLLSTQIKDAARLDQDLVCVYVLSKCCQFSLRSS